MIKSFASQAAMFALSALVTLASVASVNGIAAHQYRASETVALAQASLQTVVVIGHRTARA